MESELSCIKNYAYIIIYDLIESIVLIFVKFRFLATNKTPYCLLHLMKYNRALNFMNVLCENENHVHRISKTIQQEYGKNIKQFLT